MRVVVNQLVALGRRTGIGHYTGQLLRCLRAQASGAQIDSFPTGLVRRAYKAATRIRPLLGTADPRGDGGEEADGSGLRSRVLEYLRQSSRSILGRYFRAVCTRRKYDLYHEPNGIPLPADCPIVATLHDLSVLRYPEWHPADRVAYYEQHFRRGLRDCQHVLVVSEFSRQEVMRLLHIGPERVTRTYNGIRPLLKPLAEEEVKPVLRHLGLPPRYLLYLGTIEPRKNILMLLRAYCALPVSVRDQWPLLLVGNWGWNSADVAAYLDGEARRRGVIHLGYVREKHLAAIYNGARALVYPSWYEGFGLPPLEMMACGGAVLASTAGALVETVGSRAHLVAPEDCDGWRSAMLRVLQDEDWWRGLRRGVQEVARPYTWDRCARETLQVYRTLSGEMEPSSLQRRAAG